MPTKNQIVDEISMEVAKELGVPPEIAKTINRIQWRFLMETMQTGNLEPVQLIYIGKFVKNKKDKYVKRHKRDTEGILQDGFQEGQNRDISSKENENLL